MGQPAFLDPAAAYAVRIRSLQEEATRAYIYDLFDLLNQPADTMELNTPQEQSFLNEVMNALRRLSDPDEPLEEAFTALAVDSTRYAGTREYAVQHLGAWAKKSANGAAIVQSLLELAEDPVVSTCAVIQLNRLRNTPVAAPADVWPDLLHRRLARPGLRDADRLSLLLVATDQAHPDALPLAVQWAQETGDVHLFKAAVGTIAQLGGAGELDLLLSLKNSPHAPDAGRILAFAENQLRNKEGRTPP